MESIREYIVAVLAAVIIGVIIMRICGKHMFSSNIIKLIIAVFISLSIVAPILNIDIGDPSGYFQNFDAEANEIAENAKSEILQETLAVIIQRTEAYIEEKATLYGATISAKVSISTPESLVPDSVVISGNISPYGKISLKKIINDELGIPEDKQIWN